MATGRPHDTWSVEEVGIWLTSVGLESAVANFREQEIDGLALYDREVENLFPSIGKRARFRISIEKLKVRSFTEQLANPTEQLTSSTEQLMREQLTSSTEQHTISAEQLTSSTEQHISSSEQPSSTEQLTREQLTSSTEQHTSSTEHRTFVYAATPVQKLPEHSEQCIKKKTLFGQNRKMTVQRLLNMEGTTEKMKDRYHLLRVHNIKVYDDEFLAKQAVIKREYIRFRMDEALRLLSIGTPKSQIDGLVNISWRFKQRKNVLMAETNKLQQEEIGERFEKYKNDYTKAQTEILELDEKIQEKENELFEQIRKGIIGQQSKNIFRELIATLKVKRNELMCLIDSIAKNWEVAVKKWERCGPPKKRGRKTTSAVVFKTASELKRLRTEKRGDTEEPICVDKQVDQDPICFDDQIDLDFDETVDSDGHEQIIVGEQVNDDVDKHNVVDTHCNDVDTQCNEVVDTQCNDVVDTQCNTVVDTPCHCGADSDVVDRCCNDVVDAQYHDVVDKLCHTQGDNDVEDKLCNDVGDKQCCDDVDKQYNYVVDQQYKDGDKQCYGVDEQCKNVVDKHVTIDEDKLNDVSELSSTEFFEDVSMSHISRQVGIIQNGILIAYGTLVCLAGFVCTVNLDEILVLNSKLLPLIKSEELKNGQGFVSLMTKYVKTVKSFAANWSASIPGTLTTVEAEVMNASQFNCGVGQHSEEGSSACMGIAFMMIQMYFTKSFPDFKNVKDVLPMFMGIIQKACDLWKKDGTGPLTVNEAITKLKVDTLLEIAAETWWPTTPGAVPKSPVQLVTEFYLNSVKKNKRQAMVFTLKPNHTFVVLINEKGDQLLLESHLHYSGANLTYHETRVRPGTGAAIAFLPSGISPQWLVEDYTAIINSSSSYGEIAQIIPKN